MKRRQALALTSMLAASAALPPLASAAPAVVSGKSSFIPRRGKGPRIVICGGGWGGLSAARYLREWIPQADVILVDRKPEPSGRGR